MLNFLTGAFKISRSAELSMMFFYNLGARSCKSVEWSCNGLFPVWQHTFVSPSAFSRRAVVSYWRKYVHEVLVNRLGGLSLPRKSVVRLTDRPDMTLDVYRGRKTTMQQCNGLLYVLYRKTMFLGSKKDIHCISPSINNQ